MFISETGLNLIKEFEGCILHAYDDYNNKEINQGDRIRGTLTIGYGHIEGVYAGQVITQAQAEQLLRVDMIKYCNQVQQVIDEGTITFPVNQNQFDALVSFDYNLGQGNLRRLCAGRTAQEVSDHMTAYINAGSVWEAGLLRRRQAERKLFLTPCQSNGGDYMSKVYQNGTTIEWVYSEEDLINKIGYLVEHEKCEAIADVNGKIVVLYNSPNGKKTGFVKYRGGIK